MLDADPTVIVHRKCVVPPTAVVEAKAAMNPRQSVFIDLIYPNGSAACDQLRVEAASIRMERVTGLVNTTRHSHNANSITDPEFSPVVRHSRMPALRRTV